MILEGLGLDMDLNQNNFDDVIGKTLIKDVERGDAG